jgi:hypothetical protein
MTINVGDPSIKEITAAIEKLDAGDRQKLIDKLSAAKINDLKAAAEKRRLKRLEAAAQDPNMEVAFKTALRGLHRLGLDLEKIAAAGDVKLLDEAMTKAKWSPQERFQLKAVLANVGAIR